MDEKIYCPGCKGENQSSSQLADGEIVDLAGEEMLLINGIMVKAFR